MVRVIALHVFRQFGCATLALAFGVTIKRGASAAAIRTNFDAKRYGDSTGAVGQINGKDTPCSSTGLFWFGARKLRGLARSA